MLNNFYIPLKVIGRDVANEWIYIKPWAYLIIKTMEWIGGNRNAMMIIAPLGQHGDWIRAIN